MWLKVKLGFCFQFQQITFPHFYLFYVLIINKSPLFVPFHRKKEESGDVINSLQQVLVFGLNNIDNVVLLVFCSVIKNFSFFVFCFRNNNLYASSSLVITYYFILWLQFPPFFLIIFFPWFLSVLRLSPEEV